jgi:hypothetical protein
MPYTESRLNANLICLRKAVLCANCDVISDGANGHCVACGSQALLNLSRLLGGAIDTGMSLPLGMSDSFAAEPNKAHYLSAAA